MPCPTVQNQLISVFETTFYVKRELVTAFNIVIQTSTATVSLFRYPSDFAEFHQKVRCHYPRSKVQFPVLFSSNGQLLSPSRKKLSTHKKKASTLKILQLFQLHSNHGNSKKSNADKIEEYLEKCFQHPIISISSLLKDFLRVQREDDQRIESSLTHATTTTTATAVSTTNSSSIVPPPPLPPLLKNPILIESPPAPLDEEEEKKVTSQCPSKITLDQFELLKVIGKGCMGKVLLVQSHINSTDTTTNTSTPPSPCSSSIISSSSSKKAPPQLYALKVISKQKVLQQNEVQHTKAERDILTRLRDQPFLIKLHYAFQSQTHLYFVLDYICGGDIATQMSLCVTFSKERTQFYAAEILLGLSILHSHGIIYRDLKPENILIGRDGHIVLTDFGLSKVFKMQDKRDMGLPTTGTFCGTSEYIGPEILLGEQYSYAVDYWSLGTLIYEMLAGVTPFWADTHMEMFRRVLEDNLEFPSTDAFDPITCDFLSGLLERDPYDRLGWDSSEQIKKHAYFGNLDWDDVAQRKLTAPYIPVVHSETDLTHFDASFVAMTPRISQVQSMDDTIETDPFRRFSFDPRTASQSAFLFDDEEALPTRTLRPWGSHDPHRFSTSSSCLSFGTGEIIQHTDTMPSFLGNNHPSLATSVRKRHSAALSEETPSS